MVDLYRRHAGRADFLTIYIKEAHSTDEPHSGRNVEEGICYPQPKTMAQRVAIATDFVRHLKYPIPLLVDSLDDRANGLYAGWPERLYVIGDDRTIAYRGHVGPRGFDPDELEAWLRRQNFSGMNLNG